MDWNVAQALRHVAEAFDQGANFVALPEFSFHGFKDAHRIGDITSALDQNQSLRPFERLARKHRGYVLLNAPVHVPEGIANRSVLIGPSGRERVHYDKRLRALIDRHIGFVSGKTPGIVNLPFGRLGLLICLDNQKIGREDWAVDSGNDDDTPVDMAEAYIGCDLIVMQIAFGGYWSEKPGDAYVRTPIDNAARLLPRMAAAWREHTGAYIVVVNKTGFEGDTGFVGGSLAMAPSGQVLARASSGPEILLVDLPLDSEGRLARR